MSGAELGDSFSQADLCPTVGKGSAGLHITHKETETSFFKEIKPKPVFCRTDRIRSTQCRSKFSWNKFGVSFDSRALFPFLLFPQRSMIFRGKARPTSAAMIVVNGVLSQTGTRPSQGLFRFETKGPGAFFLVDRNRSRAHSLPPAPAPALLIGDGADSAKPA